MYVGSHLLDIMEGQEKRLGIKHFGIPKRCYDIPKWLTPSEAKSWKGGYHETENEIYLNPQRITIPGGNMTNIVPKICLWRSHQDIKKVLDHELGHFYVTNESKRLNGLGLYAMYCRSAENIVIAT